MRRRQGGENYTVFWVGSSTTMCSALALQLKPGQARNGGVTAAVKAVPDVILRAGPSTGSAVVDHVPGGEVVIVTCYADGDKVAVRWQVSHDRIDVLSL